MEEKLYLSGVMNVKGFSTKSTNDVANCPFVTCMLASSACYHLPASNSVSPYRSKLATRPESCTGDPPQATPPREEAEQGHTLTNHPQKLISVCVCVGVPVYWNENQTAGGTHHDVRHAVSEGRYRQAENHLLQR